MNVQRLVGAIGIALTALGGSLYAMNPQLAFYMIAISGALNASMSFYFGVTTTPTDNPTIPANTAASS